MIPILIIIISLLLDGILTNYLLYLPNDLTYFTPLLTLVSIFIIYPFYRKDKNKYLITVFIVGFIYDVFYTNLLFIDAIIFLIMGLYSYYINKNYKISYIKMIIYITLMIILYESFIGIIIYINNFVPITITKLIYKITHSILLNIIYADVLLFITRMIPRKYKNISINK